MNDVHGTDLSLPDARGIDRPRPKARSRRANGLQLPDAGGIDQPKPRARTRRSREQPTDPEFDFLNVASILFCRRKFIVRIAAWCAIGAAVLGLLIAPKYTATARIVVEPQQAIGSQAQVPAPADRLVTEIDTHVTRLASRDHLRRVLEGLSSPPPSSAKPATAPNGSARAAIPKDPTLGIIELARRLSVWIGALVGGGAGRELDELERGLRVIQERSSRIISVSFTARSPGRAAAVTNDVVQLYVNGLAEQEQIYANQELAALNERAGQLKSDLDKATEGMATVLAAKAANAAGGGNAEEREARLNALKREAASTGQAYGGVLQREQEIRGQQAVVAPGVRILSLASLPNKPSSVNPILFMFPALIASLIGASLLAIILERFDRPLRSQRDVMDTLGLPCLGLVPEYPRSYADRLFHYLQNEPFTPYAESIRSTLAAFDLAPHHRKPTTILVSSSVEGEGKTTVAAGLAVSAARLGRRVLLIDFDSGRPSIMRILRGPAQMPVSDLESQPLEGLIQNLADLDLDYLAMPQDTDPLTPCMTKRLQHVLPELAHRYDYVFIDGPPLLGTTETKLLATLVDSIIFVIKWGGTRREMVQNAVNLLRNALRRSGRFSVRPSVVMTQVDPRALPYYRYGDAGDREAKDNAHHLGLLESPSTIENRSHSGSNAERETVGA
jgi:succinoglycan biosynthesis transport protein ExoP